MSEQEDIYQLIKGTVEGGINGLANTFPKTKGLVDNILYDCLYKLKEYLLKDNPEKEKIKNSLIDLDKELIDMDSNDLHTIATDIGVPIFNRLSYISSSELRKTYIKLLTIAASKKKSNGFHPRHLEYLKSMSDMELIFLKDIFYTKYKVILIKEHCIYDNNNKGHYIGIHEVLPKSFENRPDLLLILDNLVSLGILKAEREKEITQLAAELKSYLEQNFDKVKLGYRYKRDSQEFKKLIHKIPQDEDYKYMVFRTTQYQFTNVGAYFIELLCS